MILSLVLHTLVNRSPYGIFINQSNYVLEILKKYGMESCDPVGTQMEIKDKLDLDQNGTPVNATKYHSMIGALMYLTSSRSDIVHAIAISCNPVQHSRTKHIAVHYHFIKEHVEKGTIKLYFVKIDYQLADLFIKALPADRFNYLVRRLVGSENCPPMLNKENNVPWSYRLLWYAKSRPNRKLIHNSIINGPYVRRMIPEPGDPNREVPVNETFRVQTDDELTEKELKQIEADDQAIQTILLGSDIGIQEKNAKLFNEWESFTSTDEESIESYYHRFLKLMNDLKRNKHFPEKIASNLKFLNNLQPEWSRHVTIVHQKKDLHIANYTQLYDFLKYNQNENYMQQPMPNPKDITDPTTAMNMALALMAKAFKLNYSTPTNNNQRISSNPRNRQIAQPGMNMGQDKQMQMVGGNGGNQFRQYVGQNVGNLTGYNDVPNVGNQNPNGNGNLVAARAEGNATGHNADLDEIEEVNANCVLMANLQQASTSGTQTDKTPVYDLDGSAERGTKWRETLEQHPANVEETRVLYDLLYNNLAIEVEKVNTVNRKLSETNAELTTELARYKNQEKCFEISQEKYEKLERCYQKSVYEEQCLSKKINALHLSSGKQIMTLNKEISDLNKQLSVEKSTISSLLEEKKKLKSDFKIREGELLDKQIQLEKKIERLQAQLGELKCKSKDTSCASDTLNPLSQKLENENVELEFQVFDQKDTACGTSANTKFAKQSILGKPLKVGETHALSKPVTSNSIPTPQGSKVMKNVKVIASGMFRINPFKPFREEKHMPNKVRESVRTNPITVSQPPVITKKVENSDSNGLSSTGVDNIKTRRPRPRSNTKNDRSPLRLRVPKVKKTKKVGSIERLASPKPSKPRSFLRWSPTGRLFNLKGKIIASSESESQSDCSKGDNACTSNPLGPTIKRFPNSTFPWQVIQICLWCVDSGCSKHKTENLKLLINFVWKFLGTVRFGNDHVAAILGFSDLQWGNILITRVYFIEGLGHNLFSVGQFCDSDLEVAFRRNACFIRNLEGVDLLSGNRSTNLYTINLHEMASAFPIYLMARASSTKSWLWHQRLSHLNFDTINNLAKNDLVSGSMPIFHMSMFKVPSGVLRSLESLCSRFFNGHDTNSRKAFWVKWKTVLASKKRGGLDVSSLYALNRGLLFKWIWRFYRQDSSLWTRVIKAIRRADEKVDVIRRAGKRSCWLNIIHEVKSLLNMGIDLKKYMRIKLGDGENTAFWEDNWSEGGKLKYRYPRLYALELCKSISVGSKLVQSSLTDSFRRIPRGGAEQQQFNEMVDLVNSISIAPMSDILVWELESSGEFTVASVRKLIDDIWLPNVKRGGLNM
nr:RNA-directed DNA polymerase, eukaryota, reverse transcriptase zinc-binding domain protein [Tanacetum cinerariifolium]